jgi:hypothetical protein
VTPHGNTNILSAVMSLWIFLLAAIWDLTLCHLAGSFLWFQRSLCLHLQGQRVVFLWLLVREDDGASIICNVRIFHWQHYMPEQWNLCVELVFCSSSLSWNLLYPVEITAKPLSVSIQWHRGSLSMARPAVCELQQEVPCIDTVRLHTSCYTLWYVFTNFPVVWPFPLYASL